MTSPVKDPDGRSSRWDDHREERRGELVLAAVTAIEQFGPDAGIARVAEAAGVSKPVLYRYFDHKQELHDRVITWAAEQVVDRIAPALAEPGAIRRRIGNAVDAYLGLLTEHPNVFRLVLRHRGTDGALMPPGSHRISATFARFIGDGMRALGLDAGGAEPWAHGLVGFGLSTGEWWLTRETMSRAAVGTYLTDFIWHGFAGIAAEHGIDLEELATRATAATVTELRRNDS
ncbi:TetR/AcrR family transcriptional regulator [Nocardioides alcanivorans]|uniref:TetR/AcrR family transcriptional regulator n=1 Tax=Nocardioides alcanivorans TaxID=2897352 RepID=UPI001F386EA9|nr:TetR/AcrR family transcriptional regulator [Nocardioides alcanivorans]